MEPRGLTDVTFQEDKYVITATVYLNPLQHINTSHDDIESHIEDLLATDRFADVVVQKIEE